MSGVFVFWNFLTKDFSPKCFRLARKLDGFYLIDVVGGLSRLVRGLHGWWITRRYCSESRRLCSLTGMIFVS